MDKINGIGIGSSSAHEAMFRKKNEKEGNVVGQSAYISIPSIGNLLNGSQGQTQSTAAGINA